MATNYTNLISSCYAKRRRKKKQLRMREMFRKAAMVFFVVFSFLLILCALIPSPDYYWHPAAEDREVSSSYKKVNEEGSKSLEEVNLPSKSKGNRGRSSKGNGIFLCFYSVTLLDQVSSHVLRHGDVDNGSNKDKYVKKKKKGRLTHGSRMFDINRGYTRILEEIFPNLKKQKRVVRQGSRSTKTKRSSKSRETVVREKETENTSVATAAAAVAAALFQSSGNAQGAGPSYYNDVSFGGMGKRLIRFLARLVMSVFLGGITMFVAMRCLMSLLVRILQKRKWWSASRIFPGEDLTKTQCYIELAYQQCQIIILTMVRYFISIFLWCLLRWRNLLERFVELAKRRASKTAKFSGNVDRKKNSPKRRKKPKKGKACARTTRKKGRPQDSLPQSSSRKDIATRIKEDASTKHQALSMQIQPGEDNVYSEEDSDEEDIGAILACSFEASSRNNLSSLENSPLVTSRLHPVCNKTLVNEPNEQNDDCAPLENIREISLGAIDPLASKTEKLITEQKPNGFSSPERRQAQQARRKKKNAKQKETYSEAKCKHPSPGLSTMSTPKSESLQAHQLPQNDRKSHMVPTDKQREEAFNNLRQWQMKQVAKIIAKKKLLNTNSGKTVSEKKDDVIIAPSSSFQVWQSLVPASRPPPGFDSLPVNALSNEHISTDDADFLRCDDFVSHLLDDDDEEEDDSSHEDYIGSALSTPSMGAHKISIHSNGNRENQGAQIECIPDLKALMGTDTKAVGGGISSSWAKLAFMGGNPSSGGESHDAAATHTSWGSSDCGSSIYDGSVW